MAVISKIKNTIKGDKWIWFIILALFLFSLLVIYSATGSLAYQKRGGDTEFYLVKQLILTFGGLGLIYVVHLVNYQFFSRASQLLFWLSIILLIITLLWGEERNFARRWLRLPVLNLSFQTSELGQLALIMYLARLLSKKQDVIDSFKEGFQDIILPVFLICGLIFWENMSSAMVLFATSVLVLFVGRVRLRYIFGLVGVSLVAVSIGAMLLLSMPEDKMKGRMKTWKGRIENYQAKIMGSAEEAKAKESFQTTQAKIAVANGGLFGRGPGNSHQKNFLPASYSDFIYAIIIEEYGLIGGFLVLFLYLAFLVRVALLIRRTPKAFGAILAFGLALSMVIQACVNMGVAVSLLPVTGLTLPLLSMGGTSTILISITFGIILSVSRYTQINQEKMQQMAVAVSKEKK